MSLVFTVLPFSRASSESVRGGCGRSDPKITRRQSNGNYSSHEIPRGNSDNACMTGQNDQDNIAVPMIG